MDEQPRSHAEPLQVVVFDTLGATNDYSNEWVEALAGVFGVHLAVVTVEGSPLRAHGALDVWPVLPSVGDGLPLHRKASKLCRAYWTWWQLVRDRPRGTVVHMQFFKVAAVEALLMLAMRWFLKARLVHTAHNALPHVRKAWHRRFYRWWYGCTDLLLVLSRTVEQDIVGSLGAKPRRLACIPHGPYTRLHGLYGQPLTQAQARANLGLPEEGFWILQFGILRTYKGLDVLLRAFARLIDAAEDRAGIRLVVAGGGAQMDFQRHRQMLTASGCEDRVLWLDRHLTDAELCLCLQASDVAVFPYRHVSQSGALMLAMTFGLPSVYSDLPGFREVMGEEAAGEAAGECVDAAFEVGNDLALSALLQHLIDDPGSLLWLKRQQQARLRDTLSWPRIAERTVAVYRAIQGPASGSG